VYLEEDFDVVCWSLKTDDAVAPAISSMSSDLTLARESDEKALRDLNLRTFSGWSLDGKKDSCMHFAVTKLIKRSLLTDKGIRFDTRLKHHEDTLFSILAVDAARTIAAVNRHYYIRTLHDGSATVSHCPGIDQGNRLYLKQLKQFVEQKYPHDPKYQIALAKYQLSCFLQCVHLDVMHPRAQYSRRQRLEKMAALMADGTYLPAVSIWSKGFKWTHRMLYFVLRCRAAIALYALAKFGLI